uniref:hypothetical protein n=1 Tax=Vibrio jasicida TaxID=766224 RepID=UPI001CA51374
TKGIQNPPPKGVAVRVRPQLPHYKKSLFVAAFLRFKHTNHRFVRPFKHSKHVLKFSVPQYKDLLMKLDFDRKQGFFENLNKDEQLEILFEDRKNMFRYIKALKEVLKNHEIENFEKEANEAYEVFRMN